MVIRTRRPQATPLATYTPPSRLILALRWLLREPGSLLAGVFLVIVAAHLLWTVVP